MKENLSAEDAYEHFQSPEKCKELMRMLLNSGLLPEILRECADYAADCQYRSNDSMGITSLPG